MSIQSLTIVLEPDAGVYFPGQDVRGRVRADVTSPMKARGVLRHAKGVLRHARGVLRRAIGALCHARGVLCQYVRDDNYFMVELTMIVWVVNNSIVKDGLHRTWTPIGNSRYAKVALQDGQWQFLVISVWPVLVVKCCFKMPNIPTETLRNQCPAVTKTVTKNYRCVSNTPP